MLEAQIRDLIERYLASRIDRDRFAQEFAGLYVQVRNTRSAPRVVQQLCNAIILPFAELSRSALDEQSFRAQLTKLRPTMVYRSGPSSEYRIQVQSGTSLCIVESMKSENLNYSPIPVRVHAA
jgi:hypothetical protein